MYKITITNAKVVDNGYGLEVNGRELNEIISTVLGTRVKNKYGYNSGLPTFKCNSCDIEITIKPKATEIYIQDSNNVYRSVEEMEEKKSEQMGEKDPETATEE